MKTPSSMNIESFNELLDVYGASELSWPAPQRVAARCLLDTSAQARQALQRAEALDVLLSAALCPEPSEALQARILSIPTRHPRQRREQQGGRVVWWPFKSAYMPALAMAAAALLGVMAGDVLFPAEPSATAAPLELSGEEWQEVSSVALAFDVSSALEGEGAQP